MIPLLAGAFQCPILIKLVQNFIQLFEPFLRRLNLPVLTLCLLFLLCRFCLHERFHIPFGVVQGDGGMTADIFQYKLVECLPTDGIRGAPLS